MYELFLQRLREIREYEWNSYDIKIFEEHMSGEYPQRGVRQGETAIEAIARHMQEVLEEHEKPPETPNDRPHQSPLCPPKSQERQRKSQKKHSLT